MGTKAKCCNVKWCTEKDHRDSHYWCDGCGGLSAEAFVIETKRGLHWIHCFQCMQALQAAVSPLTLLVQTGKDTAENKIEESKQEWPETIKVKIKHVGKREPLPIDEEDIEIS